MRPCSLFGSVWHQPLNVRPNLEGYHTNSLTEALLEQTESTCFAQPVPYPSPPMSKSATPPKRLIGPRDQLLATDPSRSKDVTGHGQSDASRQVPGSTHGSIRRQGQQEPQRHDRQPTPRLRDEQYQSSPAYPPTSSGSRGTPHLCRPPPSVASPSQARFDPPESPPSPTPGSLPTSGVMRPGRRTKAHVHSACFNCKRAHLSCDVERPCHRCVASGKQVISTDLSLFLQIVLLNLEKLGHLLRCRAQKTRSTSPT